VYVSATEIKNSFGKYLKQALQNDPVTITKNGKAVARLVPCNEPLLLRDSAAEINRVPEKMSYEAYLDLVETSEERYELIDGEVYLLASPMYAHQSALSELYVLFYNWFKGKDCRPLFAPFDVTLFKSETNINVVQPDILVICDRDKIDAQGKYHGVPALIVEVSSPSTRRKDMLKKLDLYMQTGVGEYWLIDPERKTALLYTFADNDIADCRPFVGSAVLESACFPGLQVSLDALFAN